MATLHDLNILVDYMISTHQCHTTLWSLEISYLSRVKAVEPQQPHILPLLVYESSHHKYMYQRQADSVAIQVKLTAQGSKENNIGKIAVITITVVVVVVMAMVWWGRRDDDDDDDEEEEEEEEEENDDDEPRRVLVFF